MSHFGRSGTVLDTPNTLVSILNLTTIYCTKILVLHTPLALLVLCPSYHGPRATRTSGRMRQ